MLKHCGAQSTVVFDGCGSTTLTKAVEQSRRAPKCTSVEIIFHDDMSTQAAFLTNGNKKKRLTESLREKMLLAGIRVKQEEADDDTLIVSAALAVAEEEELPVVVVSADTDLLVMMVARATTTTDIFMSCQSKLIVVFSILDVQHAIGDTRNHLM